MWESKKHELSFLWRDDLVSSSAVRASTLLFSPSFLAGKVQESDADCGFTLYIVMPFTRLVKAVAKVETGLQWTFHGI